MGYFVCGCDKVGFMKRLTLRLHDEFIRFARADMTDSECSVIYSLSRRGSDSEKPIY